jgi:hypothetical protein
MLARSLCSIAATSHVLCHSPHHQVRWQTSLAVAGTIHTRNILPAAQCVLGSGASTPPLQYRGTQGQIHSYQKTCACTRREYTPQSQCITLAALAAIPAALVSAQLCTAGCWPARQTGQPNHGGHVAAVMKLQRNFSRACTLLLPGGSSCL